MLTLPPPGSQSLGVFYCPQCLTMQHFLRGLTDQVHDAECQECEYSFGWKMDDREGKLSPVLSDKVIEEGQRRAQEAVLLGVRLQGVTLQQYERATVRRDRNREE